MLFGPPRPFCLRHLANHELPRSNLRADVVELDLPRLLLSLRTRLRHYRLDFWSSTTPLRL